MKPNKLQLKHLNNLVRVLEEIPKVDKRTFDMGQYVYGPEGVGPDGEPVTCGTPACVLGHYAARRDLQRAFVLDKTMFTVQTWDVDAPWNQTLTNHFGIYAHEIDELFGGGGCSGAGTPKEAIKFIKEFIKYKVAE